VAISDIQEYAHLTEADVEELGRQFDAIRRDIEASRGERDARYIRNTIRLQRGLEVGGRAVLFASRKRPAWLVGTAMLGLSKIIENMELGHNVMHGQWDWMNDPEIHSTTWEWDNAGPSAHWKQTHNYIHHKYTNVLGMDDDVGYGLLRVTRDQRWSPFYIGNPIYNALLQITTEVTDESVDTLASLEERINRAVQVISQLRADNDGFQAKLKKATEDITRLQAERDEAQSFSEEFQRENAALEAKVANLSEELETLRGERKQVKHRIEKLLGQLDLLSAS